MTPTTHQHESWQIRIDDAGRYYCAECGETLNPDPVPRTLQLVAEPVPQDTLPFMYERFATARDDAVQSIAFFRSPTGVQLTCEITFPDGTRVEERVNLTEMLKEWATGIINERKEPGR